MSDRMAELASLVVHYSLDVQPGEKILLESWDEADDLTQAVMSEVLAAGGIPVVDRQNMVLQRQYLIEADADAMKCRAALELERIQQMNGYLAIRRNRNVYELSDVPPEKAAMYDRIMAPVKHHRMMKTKWCVLRYPDEAMAQMCHMSTQQFREYYFSVCCLDYAAMSRAARPLEQLMKKTDQVHILAPGTDLTFSIRGCKGDTPFFPNDTGCGRLNIPDGEVGGGVVKESVNGQITYNLPASYRGTTFYDVCFQFEKGKIVSAACSNRKAQPLLDAILDTDEGSRYIGEFSLGINPLADIALGDILFDEKMWGTFHFTPGHSPSAVHWDMVLSQRPEDGGGEIWFDNQLIRRDGQFILPELVHLNPDALSELIHEGGNLK